MRNLYRSPCGLGPIDQHDRGQNREHHLLDLLGLAPNLAAACHLDTTAMRTRSLGLRSGRPMRGFIS